MRNSQFSETMFRIYGNREDGIKACRNITFQVTDDCPLRCKYCYQADKGHKMMLPQTAKNIVDLLFRMWDEDDSNAIINKKTKALVLEFIGGEPFMNMEAIEAAVEHFWMKALERHHPWADNFRLSIATNGVLYFNERVQRFIQKYKHKLSMSVSIDGDKEMHDSCRVFPNGDGSWEIASRAEEHYIKTYNGLPSSKATISRENLPYLDRTVRYFISKGYKVIYANTIYEEDWNIADARVYYDKLKILADTMLQDGGLYISLFDEVFFRPIPENENTNWCGGAGEMISFDTEGIAFPCIRYMESSLGGKQTPVAIGNCERGIYKTKEENAWKTLLRGVDRRSQSDDECYYCPIAKGCAHCIAYDYQKHGTFYERDKGSCVMHKARSLANVYYWNKKYRAESSEKRFKMYLPKEEAVKIVSEEEYEMLLNLTKE